MKKLLSIIFFMEVNGACAQQWLGSGAAHGTIYRAGKIKIGYGPLYIMLSLLTINSNI